MVIEIWQSKKNKPHDDQAALQWHQMCILKVQDSYTILSLSFGQHEHFTTIKKLNNWIFLLYPEINHFLKSGGIILYGHSYTQNMLENSINFDHQNCANL